MATCPDRILIEPFGIETDYNTKQRRLYNILIEPFGIETVVMYIFDGGTLNFNRTIWN